MKKNLFIWTVICLLSVTSFSQDKEPTKDDFVNPTTKDIVTFCKDCEDDDILYYDFTCKEFYKRIEKTNSFKVTNPATWKARYNKKMRIKIIHINRYKYDVALTIDDVDFGSDPPPIFSQVFLGTGDFASQLAVKLKDLSKDGDEVKDFITSLNDFKTKYNELIEQQISAYSGCPKLPGCCKPDEQKTFSSISSDLYELKKKYIVVNEVFIDKFDKINKKLKDIKDELVKLEAELKKLKADLELAAKDKKKTLADDIEKKEKEIAAKQEVKTIEESNLKKEEGKKSDLDKLFATFTSISEQELMKLTLFYNNFNSDHFYYISPPIYPQGNLLQVQLGMASRDSSLVKKWNIHPTYSDSIKFSIPVVWKPFVSFSTGPFFGLSDKTTSELFGFEPQPTLGGLITDSAKYKLVPTGKSSKPIGVAGLATIGAKFSRTFGLGLSLGAGLTIEPKPRPNYLIGVTLFGGSRQQFNLSFGANIVQIDQLKSELYPDISNTLYDVKPEIEYKRQTAVGCFISLTYSIFTTGNSRSISSSSK